MEDQVFIFGMGTMMLVMRDFTLLDEMYKIQPTKNVAQLKDQNE